MPRVHLLRSCEPALLRARGVVSAMPGWKITGMSQRLGDAGSALQSTPPDILAADLRFTDGRIDRLAQQCRFWPRPPTILLLAETVDDVHLFDALRWGAHAYCVVQSDGRGLEHGLRRLTASRACMSPGIAQRSLALFGLPRSRSADALTAAAAGDQTPVGLAPGLARCGQHLLSLMAGGMLAGEIAQHWDVQEVEIERRLAAVYRALHALLTHTTPERMTA